MKGSMQMDEEKIIEYDEAVEEEYINPEAQDELRGAIEDQFKKIQTQNLLLGFQVCASSVLEKINILETKPGKHTFNDHRRLIKEIKEFCKVGLSRKVNPDGTTSLITDEINQGGEEDN
jgi:hypothetical protein